VLHGAEKLWKFIPAFGRDNDLLYRGAA